MEKIVFLFLLATCLTIIVLPVSGQDVQLDLMMPDLGGASLFYLYVSIENYGPSLENAQFFVAISITPGEFMFFPTWVVYPPDVDWIYLDLDAGYTDVLNIVQPVDIQSGNLIGLIAYAAVVHDDVLVSNLAEAMFGNIDTIIGMPVPTFSPNPSPTPASTTTATPAEPSATPTPAEPSATPTPFPTDTPTQTPTNTPGGFVYFYPGSFIQGSPLSEPCRMVESQEYVTLTRGFYMMQTEVSRQMWADLKALQPTLPNDPSITSYSPTMNHPVQDLTYYEMLLFANLMSNQYGYTRCYYKDAAFTIPVDETNYIDYTNAFYCDFDANGYRLPTTLEWEYACRAGTTGPFSCDETNYNSDNCLSCTPGVHPTLEQYSVYCGNIRTRPEVVGSRLPNPAGLYDMHGNVSEACWPTGPSIPGKGGSWLDEARYCRSATISLFRADWRYTYVGFRLVMTSMPSQTPTPRPTPTGFILVDSGSFIMGSPLTEPCRSGTSGGETQHQVTLTRDFYMMQTEVTRQMWADLKAAQPSLTGDPSSSSYSPTMNHPVQKVAWTKAALYANLMSVRYGFTPCYYRDYDFLIPVDATNFNVWWTVPIYCDYNANGFRLPTEAEWEYACRAGTTGAFSCDETSYNSENCVSCTPGVHPTLEQYSVYCTNNTRQAEVVGSQLPNPAGLYDMHGNVGEWCSDWHERYPLVSVTDPTGPSSGTTRIYRGGSWDDSAITCRSAHRSSTYQINQSRYLGFRLVRLTIASTPSPTPTPTATTTPVPTGFVYFSPGSFTMGSPSTEPCRDSDETQYQVTLSRGFVIMLTEVTRQMWADLKAVQPRLPDDPSSTVFSPTMNHPVQALTWYETMLFANLMSIQHGFTQCYYKDAAFTTPVDESNYIDYDDAFFCNFNANGYRLPTEAEWEYACRAGTTGAFSCDETNYTSDTCAYPYCLIGEFPILEQFCVFCANGNNRAEVCGSRFPNPGGLYDMQGNVWEWCWDRYATYPTGSVTDPTGSLYSPLRVGRGGSFTRRGYYCRSARRIFFSRDTRGGDIGFRLVRTVSGLPGI